MLIRHRVVIFLAYLLGIFAEVIAWFLITTMGGAALIVPVWQVVLVVVLSIVLAALGMRLMLHVVTAHTKLCKRACQHCFRRTGREWTQEHDKDFNEKGWVYCDRPIRGFIQTEPPEDCPYLVEHLVGAPMEEWNRLWISRRL